MRPFLPNQVWLVIMLLVVVTVTLRYEWDVTSTAAGSVFEALGATNDATGAARQGQRPVTKNRTAVRGVRVKIFQTRSQTTFERPLRYSQRAGQTGSSHVQRMTPSQSAQRASPIVISARSRSNTHTQLPSASRTPSLRPPAPAAPRTSSARPANLTSTRIAVFEMNQYHTEIQGFIVEWCYDRGYEVTLYVSDNGSFRSFIPIYRRLFRNLRVRKHMDWVHDAPSFNLTIFGTAIGHTKLPASVLEAMNALPASRTAFVLHHIDGANDHLQPHHRRLISLSPLLATPYVTPLILAGDAAWAPPLRLADRHRSLCMIGDGASKRYETADIFAFIAAQNARVASSSEGDDWLPLDAEPPVAGAFVLGAAAVLPPMEQEEAAAAAAAGAGPPLRVTNASTGGAPVVWEPASLRWWWRGRVPGAVHRPWHIHNYSRTTNSATTVGSGERGMVSSRASQLRSHNVTLARTALGYILRHAGQSRNDAKPGPAPLTGLFLNYDSAKLLAETRRCAFVLIHPIVRARERNTRMTGALPTAMMARTPILAPRSLTDVYNISGASVTFNSSLAEVADFLDSITDEHYDALLRELDATRERMKLNAGAVLDRFLSEPSWGGIDALGPGWNLRIEGNGGPLKLIAAERRRRGVSVRSTPSRSNRRVLTKK